MKLILLLLKKNYKLNLKDKIKNYKFFDKRAKEKKIRSRMTKSKNIIYMQIRIEGLN
jgi:hypothetical protein